MAGNSNYHHIRVTSERYIPILSLLEPAGPMFGGVSSSMQVREVFQALGINNPIFAKFFDAYLGSNASTISNKCSQLIQNPTLANAAKVVDIVETLFKYWVEKIMNNAKFSFTVGRHTYYGRKKSLSYIMNYMSTGRRVEERYLSSTPFEGIEHVQTAYHTLMTYFYTRNDNRVTGSNRDKLSPDSRNIILFTPVIDRDELKRLTVRDITTISMEELKPFISLAVDSRAYDVAFNQKTALSGFIAAVIEAYFDNDFRILVFPDLDSELLKLTSPLLTGEFGHNIEASVINQIVLRAINSTYQQQEINLAPYRVRSGGTRYEKLSANYHNFELTV